MAEPKGAITTKGIAWSAVVLFLIVGGVVVGLNNGKLKGVSATKGSNVQAGTPEGAAIPISVPSGVSVPAGAVALFTDTGPHGWHAVQQGGGSFMQYDGTQGLKYKSPATKDASGNYTTTVPTDICGDVILPQGAPLPAPKVVDMTLTDASGNPIPGTTPQKVTIKCDVYNLQVSMKANPDKALADGKDSSTVTTVWSVKGPAKFYNATRIPYGANRPTITTPLGLMDVHFNTSMGVLNPTPSNVKTDFSGTAAVTITSVDAGIAKVMAQASGVGDAQVNVHFMPKITAVKEDFVPPTSPTNYQIQTIPANPKDLTIDWKFLPAAGATCGGLTGGASGLGLVKNAFYHGPSDGFPNGCDEKWEQASQVQVTVTDKDGGTDTKTFPARAYEGQGFVKL